VPRNATLFGMSDLKLDVQTCLGVANVLLILVLVAQALHAGRRERKMTKLQAANEGLSHVLNATYAENTALRKTMISGGVSPPPPRPSLPSSPPFLVPPPLDLTPPEGDDGESWDDGDGIKTSFLDRDPLTTTQRMAIDPELIEASKPPSGESGVQPIPTGAKRTGRT
jgi:hypothetical protein